MCSRRRRRVEFYHHQLNLIAVTAQVNDDKSDVIRVCGSLRSAGAGARTPLAYIRVKRDHGLGVDQRERDGLERMLDTCL